MADVSPGVMVLDAADSSLAGSGEDDSAQDDENEEDGDASFQPADGPPGILHDPTMRPPPPPPSTDEQCA